MENAYTVPNKITYRFKTWEELTKDELYAILHLRAVIFVVEQHCPYIDPDNEDQYFYHLLGLDGDQLVSYLRISKAVNGTVKLGRVVVKEEYRDRALGHEIMDKGVALAWEKLNAFRIDIEAQSHLQKFYEQHGFIRKGDEFLLDDIPHIHMYLIKPS